MQVRAIPVGAFQENAYIIVDESSGDAALVDPGEEGERLVRAVESLGGRLRQVWVTHAHVDHVGGIAAVKRVADVPVYLHPADRQLYDNAAQHGLLFGLRIDPPPPPDHELAEGDTLRLGALAFDVWHVPGHAPGHVAIIGHGAAFVGDCIFAGSIGRTDLPLCSATDLSASLERLCTLPDATVLYPGHGPETILGSERESNPFLNGSVRLVERQR